MIKNNLCRLGSLNLLHKFESCFYNPFRSFSKRDDTDVTNMNEPKSSYYTAKDIEFCPNRAKEVMQSYVQETSQNASCDDAVCENEKTDSSVFQSDKDHVNLYQSGNSVSLYSVMQSNVPEPFTTKDKAPTHLNMPGSSSNQGYKYLSGKMQNTHQSKQ